MMEEITPFRVVMIAIIWKKMVKLRLREVTPFLLMMEEITPEKKGTGAIIRRKKMVKVLLVQGKTEPRLKIKFREQRVRRLNGGGVRVKTVTPRRRLCFECPE